MLSRKDLKKEINHYIDLMSSLYSLTEPGESLVMKVDSLISENPECIDLIINLINQTAHLESAGYALKAIYELIAYKPMMYASLFATNLDMYTALVNLADQTDNLRVARYSAYIMNTLIIYRPISAKEIATKPKAISALVNLINQTDNLEAAREAAATVNSLICRHHESVIELTTKTNVIEGLIKLSRQSINSSAAKTAVSAINNLNQALDIHHQSKQTASTTLKTVFYSSSTPLAEFAATNLVIESASIIE